MLGLDRLGKLSSSPTHLIAYQDFEQALITNARTWHEAVIHQCKNSHWHLHPTFLNHSKKNGLSKQKARTITRLVLYFDRNDSVFCSDVVTGPASPNTQTRVLGDDLWSWPVRTRTTDRDGTEGSAERHCLPRRLPVMRKVIKTTIDVCIQGAMIFPLSGSSDREHAERTAIHPPCHARRKRYRDTVGHLGG